MKRTTLVWDLSASDVERSDFVRVEYGGRVLFTLPLASLRPDEPADTAPAAVEPAADATAPATVRRVKGGHWHCSICGKLPTVTSEAGARIHIGRLHKIASK